MIWEVWDCSSAVLLLFILYLALFLISHIVFYSVASNDGDGDDYFAPGSDATVLS